MIMVCMLFTTEFSRQSSFYTYPFNSDRMNIFVVNDASDELKSVEVVSAATEMCSLAVQGWFRGHTPPPLNEKKKKSVQSITLII